MTMLSPRIYEGDLPEKKQFWPRPKLSQRNSSNGTAHQVSFSRPKLPDRSSSNGTGKASKLSFSRPKTSNGVNGTAGHKVSFSDSSKSSHDHGPSDQSASSRSSSPRLQSPNTMWGDNRNWQKINRRSEALWKYGVCFLSPGMC